MPKWTIASVKLVEGWVESVPTNQFPLQELIFGLCQAGNSFILVAAAWLPGSAPRGALRSDRMLGLTGRGLCAAQSSADGSLQLTAVWDPIVLFISVTMLAKPPPRSLPIPRRPPRPFEPGGARLPANSEDTRANVVPRLATQRRETHKCQDTQARTPNYRPGACALWIPR